MEEIKIIPESIQLIKMSDEEYFSSKYKEYISNSRLGLLNPDEGGSIEKYLSGFKSDYSDSFELGSAVHSMILQPDFYFISKLDKPTGKLGLFVDTFFTLRGKGLKIKEAINLASEQANYYSGSLSETRFKTAFKKSIDYYLKRIKTRSEIETKIPLYLSKPMKEKVDLCMNGITSNKQVMNLLFPEGLLSFPEVFNEYAIFCEVEVIIDGKTYRLKLKGKLDNFTIDHENSVITLNDLKTTGKPAGFFMGNMIKEMDESGEYKERWIDGSFQKYHYYRQVAMYLWLLNAALQAKYGYVYTLKSNILLVETIPNFRSKVCKVNNKYIKKGLAEFKKLLIHVAKCEIH